MPHVVLTRPMPPPTLKHLSVLALLAVLESFAWIACLGLLVVPTPENGYKKLVFRVQPLADFLSGGPISGGHIANVYKRQIAATRFEPLGFLYACFFYVWLGVLQDPSQDSHPPSSLKCPFHMKPNGSDTDDIPLDLPNP